MTCLRSAYATDLIVIRKVVDDWKPHIVFNLLEEFSGVAIYDQNVVSIWSCWGCLHWLQPARLDAARDKALAKKILHYHRIAILNLSRSRSGAL